MNDYIEYSNNLYSTSDDVEENIVCWMCEGILKIPYNDVLAQYKHSCIKYKCPHCGYVNYMIYYPEYHKKGKKK